MFDNTIRERNNVMRIIADITGLGVLVWIIRGYSRVGISLKYFYLLIIYLLIKNLISLYSSFHLFIYF